MSVWKAVSTAAVARAAQQLAAAAELDKPLGINLHLLDAFPAGPHISDGYTDKLVAEDDNHGVSHEDSRYVDGDELDDEDMGDLTNQLPSPEPYIDIDVEGDSDKQKTEESCDKGQGPRTRDKGEGVHDSGTVERAGR